MTVQQQRPDGGWEPAKPLGYQPGWDVERTARGQWVLYRTTRADSVEVARGRYTLGLLLASLWFRLTQPIRER